MKIIWPVILTVKEWQIVMVFRFKCYEPNYYVWARTTMPKYRRWKRKAYSPFLRWVGNRFAGSDISAGWEP